MEYDFLPHLSKELAVISFSCMHLSSCSPFWFVFFRSSRSSPYFCNLSSAHSLKTHQLFVLFSLSFVVSFPLALSAHFLLIFRMVSERKNGNFSAACRRSATRTFAVHITGGDRHLFVCMYTNNVAFEH